MQLALPHASDLRSAEILAKVRQAFVAKGFDGASMQDLARAAGMSVGNFYRYFPSKSAIITGLIEKDLADIQRDFQAILGAPRPMQMLRLVLDQRLDEHVANQEGALWSEIEAAARRNPEISLASLAMESGVVECLVQVFAAETGLDFATARARFATQAAFILVLFKSAVCLNCARNVDKGELKSMLTRTIHQTLDSVAPSAPKA
jgi:AcrR family transcriptional regulator